MSTTRLLILDDDPDVARTVGFIAEGAGAESRATEKAADFFRELAQWEPTHVMLDLMMPGMDGVEVLRRLALSNCRTRIIIGSGAGSRVLDAARLSATEHGLNIVGALPKPFTAAALRALLADSGEEDKAAAAPAARRPAQSFEVTEANLGEALENHEFQLAYQPKVYCATGDIAGFEALVRWHRPGVGVVMPDSFIPLSESSGLIRELTREVFDIGLKWLADGVAPPQASLSLNLSAKSLGYAKFADHVVKYCDKWSVDSRRVILEVTESAAMADPTTALDILTRLCLKGFGLSIDDFGTGFSSMVQLARIPFSELKIDKSFVLSAMSSSESRTIIKAIVGLGQALDLKVVAEGVEDQETLDFLKHLGCDLAQGYFIARPMPPDNVAGWLAARSNRDGNDQDRPLLHY